MHTRTPVGLHAREEYRQVAAVGGALVGSTSDNGNLCTCSQFSFFLNLNEGFDVWSYFL